MMSDTQNEPMEEEISDEGDKKAGPLTSDEDSENSLNVYETQFLGFTPVTLINGSKKSK